jgi:hypothetical protein
MTSPSDHSSDARAGGLPLGSLTSGPFSGGGEELPLMRHGANWSRDAEALREEFLAAAQRRRVRLAKWRSEGSGGWGWSGAMDDAPCAGKSEPDELFKFTRRSLAGLALLDGGTRSANFALGALQGLVAAGALEAFDFRSTVPGGGFTGGHALVERGCRYIYLLGGGPDPKPWFSDVGKLIRRCRIDFGAEIDLADGVAAVWQEETPLINAHVVRGTITYAPAHLRMLGWGEDEIAMNRWGEILWVKPAVTQQTMAPFHDESRFEGYRALGYESVSSWLKELPMPVIAIDPSSLFPFEEGASEPSSMVDGSL